VIKNDLLTQNSSKLLKTITLKNFLPTLDTPKASQKKIVGPNNLFSSSLSPKIKDLHHSQAAKNLNIPPISKIIVNEIGKQNKSPSNKNQNIDLSNILKISPKNTLKNLIKI
jgi:hypothetical protein